MTIIAHLYFSPSVDPPAMAPSCRVAGSLSMIVERSAVCICDVGWCCCCAGSGSQQGRTTSVALWGWKLRLMSRTMRYVHVFSARHARDQLRITMLPTLRPMLYIPATHDPAQDGPVQHSKFQHSTEHAYTLQSGLHVLHLYSPPCCCCCRRCWMCKAPLVLIWTLHLTC